jgi:hypothetical protein
VSNGAQKRAGNAPVSLIVVAFDTEDFYQPGAAGLWQSDGVGGEGWRLDGGDICPVLLLISKEEEPLR